MPLEHGKELWEATRKNAFVINDVDLVVPPTSIAVNKEDLVYQWKTLRTKAATKIPSGHGQIVVHVTIPFTGGQILDLHRLLVEFRNSPYVYIENRYLRESIVPQWPLTQNMAFTVSAVEVSPMPGSSDTWLMQLQLYWFNYFPFVHNFLFRDEWQTVWLEDEQGRSQGDQFRQSIGWTTDETGRRYHSPVITAVRTADEAGHKEWDLQRNEYKKKSTKTIQDLEALHLGAEWDLLPVPGRMEPARWVRRPVHSRIYTRYINLLQRDALKKHFGIDVEKLLRDGFAGGDDVLKEQCVSAFFGVLDVRGVGPKTYALHAGGVRPPYAKAWQSMARAVRSEMMRHHNGARFIFEVYKDFRFPAEWLKKARAAQSSALDAALAALEEGSQTKADWLTLYYYDGFGERTNRIKAQLPLRRRFSRTTGIHSFIQKKDGTYLSWSELAGRTGQGIVERSPRTNQAIYGSANSYSSVAGRAHEGTDYSGADGEAVCSILPGRVRSVTTLSNPRNSSQWYWWDDGATGPVSDGAYYQDWKDSISQVIPAGTEIPQPNSRGVRFSTPDLNVPGLYFKSRTESGRYYFVQPQPAGQVVVVTHPEHDSAYSRYMHLASVSVRVGDVVEAGQPIGKLGNTSIFSESFLDYKFTRISDGTPEGRLARLDPFDPDLAASEGAGRFGNGFNTSYHLHFEFWEPESLGRPIDLDEVDNGQWHSRRAHWVPVDPRKSFESALDPEGFSDLETTPLTEDEQQLVEEVVNKEFEEGVIGQEEAAELAEFLDIMGQSGWRHYEGNSKLANVWSKVITLEVGHPAAPALETQALEQWWLGDDAVLTAVSGGLHHVVTNVPVLGHEYPTQQHLGSIEPTYTFEFALKDTDASPQYGDSGIPGERALEGLPQSGRWLEGMRAALQMNARRFREVNDSWCVATDSFITRLLGTYNDRDFLQQQQEIAGQSRVVNLELRKRTLIKRSDAGTVEGNPGLSFMNLEVCETNPYEFNKITSAGHAKQDVEDSRKEILNAVYNLDFVEDREKILLVMFAQLANESVADGASPLFGQFSLDTISSLSHMSALDNPAIATLASGAEGNPYGEDVLLVRDEGGQSAALLEAMGVQFQPGRDGWTSGGSPVLQVPFSSFGSSGGGPEVPVGPDSADTVPWAGVGQNNLEARERNREFVSTVLPGSRLVDNPNSALPGQNRVYQSVDMLRTTYDISEVLRDPEMQKLGNVPITLIADAYKLVEGIARAAAMLIADDTSELQDGSIAGEALGQGYVRDQLYCLPIDGLMWRSWQAFLTRAAARTAEGGLKDLAINQLQNNLNWLVWQDNLAAVHPQLANDIKTWEMSKLGAAAAVMAFGQNAGGGMLELLWDGAKSNYYHGPRILAEKAGLASASGQTIGERLGLLHHTTVEAVLNVNRRLVKQYMRMLPISHPTLLGLFNDWGLDNIVGDTIGAVLGDEFDEAVGPLIGWQRQLQESVLSSGNWLSNPGGRAYFNIVGHVGFRTPGNIGLLGFSPTSNSIGLNTDPDVFVTPQVTTVRPEDHQVPEGFVGPTRGADGFVTTANVDGPSSGAISGLAREQEVGLFGEELRSGDRTLKPTNSPFVWTTDKDAELRKVQYIRQLLARVADRLLANPQVLKAFGLEHLVELMSGTSMKGQDAYPDMDLPFHPYFGDGTNVGPDFYMWNIYDDAGALGPGQMAEITRAAEQVIDNCYKSLQGMQAGQSFDAKSNAYVSESADLGERIQLDTKFDAEGTDGNFEGGGQYGPMASPFYPTEGSSGYVDMFLGEADEKDRGTESEAKQVVDAEASENKQKLALQTNRKEIARLTPPGVTLSNTEGFYGQGGGIQYPRRASSAIYDQLRDAVESTENMFGSRSGHLGLNIDEETSPTLFEKLKGTRAERPDEYAHLFDPQALKALARDSTQDLVSRKMSMRRAYPTFKLFFVEEDEFENRLLAFDDFHSYNGVREFTVVMNRKDAADHAVIQLQNVAGALDGTQRDAIVDLDYFANPRDPDAADRASRAKESGDPITANTKNEQAFSAIVLRPGVNVQLRAGYSNNPNDLHVLISGRVVDITWNKSGDLAEIMVQSFGSELVQAIKGTQRNEGKQPIYYTTHQLLSSLMLSPEVAHFGRWEFGQTFQVHEAQDARLDFFSYDRQGYLGRFNHASKATKWFLDHPAITFGLALGITALSLFPGGGRVVGQGAAQGGAVARFFKAAAGQSANFLTRGGSRTAGAVLQATRASSLTKVLQAAVGEAGAGTVAAGRLLTPAQKAVAVKSLKGTLINASTAAAGNTKLTRAYQQLFARSWDDLAKLLADPSKYNSIDDLVALSSGFQTTLRNSIFKGQWLGQPAAKLGIASVMSGTGLRTLGGNLFTTIFTSNAKVLLAAGAVGGLYSILDGALLQPIIRGMSERVKRFFAMSKVSIMLSPQDDNLFPPHPKDYMRIKNNTWVQNAKQWALHTGVTAFTASDETGRTVLRWFDRDTLFDKRVEPETCQYQLVSTTIWNVFHEMSLRHPGWIYATRPYGNDFRYTMFFGVPSQRYWAKPASALFIDRVNNVHHHLQNGLMTEDSYRQLYGDTLEDGRTIEEYREAVRDTIVSQGPRQQRDDADASAPNGDTFADAELDLHVREFLTSRALREYLRALEVRFIPFRRYHSVSSERDLVWNGIMSSENAVYNAVDVTYYESDASTTDGKESPYGTALFKAHAFIPPHQLRIMPLQFYRNCKGYEMAARYGMGQLMHTMREMYRGEVIVLGNPRMRPWDHVVMMDSYNDMVGPFEIEQVVHTFSFETGFITELKPAAIVIGNEISSWPLLEAMKLWALGVRDMEQQISGERIEDLGFISDVADAIQGEPDSPLGWVADFWNTKGTKEERDELMRRYRHLMGQANGDIQATAFGGKAPDLEELDALREGIAATFDTVAPAVVGGATLSAVAATVLGGIALSKVPGGKFLVAPAVGLGATGTVLGAVGATGAVMATSSVLNTNLTNLLGGPLLFLQVLRNQSVIVVPLTKNGSPIVSGLNYHDPSMLWQNFAGDLKRYVEDSVRGTSDLLDLWSEYGQHAWRRLPSFRGDQASQANNLDLTGTTL